MRWPWFRVGVSGPSMAPTLRHGDLLVVRRGGRPIRPGDVVVTRLPDRPLGVKRVTRQEPGGWWLEGDNPAGSTGSETFGTVADDAIVGRVVWRYWPLRRTRGGV